MAKFFDKIKTQMKERELAAEILATPASDRPLVVYAEDDYTWNQLGPYIESFLEVSKLPVTYVTSDHDDPLLATPPPNTSVYAIRDSIAALLPKLDSPAFLTTMPDLDTYHIKRPRNASCVYAFHSLNSTTMAYRPRAFDAYDVFFCTGPHHTVELNDHFAQIGRDDVQLLEVGYPKLDRLVERYRQYSAPTGDRPTALVAPTWGPTNALAQGGESIVRGLRDAGFRVIVRPHPAFFESIYTDGAKIVARLEKTFADDADVTFENTITSEQSYMDADLMVSDWSGASFEFALGTERPVLFIDVPPKVNNPDWATAGHEPFEMSVRSRVGTVVPPDSAAVADAATSLLEQKADYKTTLESLRIELVYNPGTSAAVGGRILADLAGAESS